MAIGSIFIQDADFLSAFPLNQKPFAFTTRHYQQAKSPPILLILISDRRLFTPSRVHQQLAKFA